MSIVRAALLLCPVLLLSVPVGLSADEAPDAPHLATRTFAMQHLEATHASSLLRGVLNVRRTAVDEQRQMLVLSDTPDMLERAATLLAQLDVPLPEWAVTLVARSGSEQSVLRTASITNGRLDLFFGPNSKATPDTLRLSATVERVSCGRIDLEWSAELDIAGQWAEEARARETLYDQATVTLLATPDPIRQKALARLLGLPGSVDALVLEVAKAGAGLPRE